MPKSTKSSNSSNPSDSRRSSKSRTANKKSSRSSKTVTGVVQGHPDGFGFVLLDDQQDIYLDKRQMAMVFPGDLVTAQPGKEDRRGRREGRIVDVLQRNTKQLVGTYHFERGFGFVRPENRRINVDIAVAPDDLGGAKSGQIVIVEVTEQPTEYSPAYGRISEVLGDAMAPGMEVEVAIRSFDIPNEWTDEVLEQADSFGAEVGGESKKDRLDLTHLDFVTIDGEDAKDFDDAVYAESVRGGGWKLWVAIADVSHYVKPSSPLDKEAYERGTSVYFPNFVVPMLPEVLSNGLCSLRPKVDRLAMVCEMNISARGEIKKFQFSEALIRSKARLTYTTVGKVLEERGKEESPERDALGGLVPGIDRLHALYQVLFAGRKKRGALEFESMEVRFEFNEDRKIEGVVPIVRNDAHRLIEECMLCANICAAKFLEKHKIPALYRVHLPPQNEKLEALREYLSHLGLNLSASAKPEPSQFKALIESLKDRPDRQVIQTQILRSQQQAVYQPENEGHFGLAYPEYAHFTSPIRRYPDLLVHRAIRSITRSGKGNSLVRKLTGAKTSSSKKEYPYDLATMVNFGEHCSATERRAEEASRDVIQWLKCEYLKDRVGEKMMAVVTAVTQFGLFAELADISIEGLIHITSLPKDYYDFDSHTLCLIGRETQRKFSLGDKALVQIARVSLEERKIDLVLADEHESTRPTLDGRKAKEGRSRERRPSKRSSGKQTSGRKAVSDKSRSSKKKTTKKSSKGKSDKQATRRKKT